MNKKIDKKDDSKKNKFTYSDDKGLKIVKKETKEEKTNTNLKNKNYE